MSEDLPNWEPAAASLDFLVERRGFELMDIAAWRLRFEGFRQAATLSGRLAQAEPRHHDASHRLSIAGNRPRWPVQSDAEPMHDLDRGVRDGREGCCAGRAKDQTRLAPRSRMARANPHGLGHRRRLRVPGQDLPIADQNRARHYRRRMVGAPILRADEKVGDCNSDARQSIDRRADDFGELKWLSPVKTVPCCARGSAAPSAPANLRRKGSSRNSILSMRSAKPVKPTLQARSTKAGLPSPRSTTTEPIPEA